MTGVLIVDDRAVREAARLRPDVTLMDMARVLQKRGLRERVQAVIVLT
jgi:hypothetical protein